MITEELSEIKLSEMDPRLQQVRVVGKGAKARMVPVSREARKALKRWLNTISSIPWTSSIMGRIVTMAAVAGVRGIDSRASGFSLKWLKFRTKVSIMVMCRNKGGCFNAYLHRYRKRTQD